MKTRTGMYLLTAALVFAPRVALADAFTCSDYGHLAYDVAEDRDGGTSESDEIAMVRRTFANDQDDEKEAAVEALVNRVYRPPHNSPINERADAEEMCHKAESE